MSFILSSCPSLMLMSHYSVSSAHCFLHQSHCSSYYSKRIMCLTPHCCSVHCYGSGTLSRILESRLQLHWPLLYSLDSMPSGGLDWCDLSSLQSSSYLDTSRCKANYWWNHENWGSPFHRGSTARRRLRSQSKLSSQADQSQCSRTLYIGLLILLQWRAGVSAMGTRTVPSQQPCGLRTNI